MKRIKKPFLLNWMYMAKAFAIILLGGFLHSCNWFGPQPSFGDDYITYIIPAGEHDISQNKNSLFNGNILKFQAIFDSSAVYNTVVPENKYDVNKLMGFSDCSSQHHENSARFGWNWYENALHIFAYTYVNGNRIVREIATTKIGHPNVYQIEIVGNQYIFTFDNQVVSMDRHCSGGVGIAYNLYPYFGGDETAPHKIKLKIRNL